MVDIYRDTRYGVLQLEIGCLGFLYQLCVIIGGFGFGFVWCLWVSECRIDTGLIPNPTYRGSNPRIVLAVIGGAMSSSSIISSVSSSSFKEVLDLVGD